MTEQQPWAEALGPCYTRAGLAEVLGWTEAKVARAGEELRLLEVRTSDGVDLYPAFQLKDGRVVAGLPEVLAVLRSGTASRWTWVQFLNVPLPGRASHVQSFHAGHSDDVLLDARRTAAAWSA